MSSQTEAPKARREPKPLNGVDTPALFATINAVGESPELAKFRFRATNRWIQGTHSETRMEKYSGAGGDNAIRVSFKIEGDAPAEKLRQIVEQSKARSAVFDVLTNGTQVDITVDAA